MKNSFLRGTGVALTTPLLPTGTIDFDALTALIRHCIQGKVDYFVVLGTTSESTTLRTEEKHAIVKHVAHVNNKRLPLVIGVGSNDTLAVVDAIQSFDLSDYQALLSVVPMYTKPSQEGIYQHYKYIHDRVDLPILLYNVPSRTASNLQMDTVLRLASLERIIGIKEATYDFGQVLHLLQNKPDNFLVISGDDKLSLPTVCAGGDGVISVVAQAIPKQYTEMIRLGLSGKIKIAFEKLYEILPLIDLAFAEGNPTGIKAILHALQLTNSDVRLPLVQATTQLVSKIKEQLLAIK